MNRLRKGKHGQAMTEYIIIVAIIALAALAVFGLFGDRIRAMIGGAVQDAKTWAAWGMFQTRGSEIRGQKSANGRQNREANAQHPTPNAQCRMEKKR